MKRTAQRHKIIGTQKIGSMCYVCGKDNPVGLHAHFYNLEDGKVMGEFAPSEELQSFPDRMHGGMTSAFLDELMNRAMLARDPGSLSVTTELKVRFRQPLPLDRPVRGLAWITRERSRLYEAEAQIVLEDGSVAAEATGSFFYRTADKLGGQEGVRYYFEDEDADAPEYIDL